MEILTYSTNINTEEGVQRISGPLDLLVGPNNWQIDLGDRDHKLTVYSPGSVNQIKVKEAIKSAGFRALDLQEYYSVY